jgi:RNA polymerase sigma-70 factor (ECF subfamily)
MQAANAQHRRQLAQWVAVEILPHEARIRTWLRRSRLSSDDVDEIVQEAYCRIAMLESVDHITVPDAYFFSIVRNLLLRRLKRQRIVPFETIAEIESFQDDRPSPEQVIGSKLAYEKVLALIADLPERCRHIVQLRKIEGWSQREIAEHLGTTEKAVEKQIWIGIRAVREAWRLSNQTDESARPARDYREGHR